MKIENIDALKALQEKLKNEKNNTKVRILVGMSSCNIAAGSKEVMAKFKEILKKNKIDGLEIAQTGCAGYCYTEPVVEVCRGDEKLLLGPVREEDVQNVYDMHIANNLKESKYVIPVQFKSCFE